MRPQPLRIDTPTLVPRLDGAGPVVRGAPEDERVRGMPRDGGRTGERRRDTAGSNSGVSMMGVQTCPYCQGSGRRGAGPGQSACPCCGGSGQGVALVGDA